MTENISRIPLAEALRPKNLDAVCGQEDLLGRHGFLRKVIDSGKPLSVLFWGPPGCGKTSIARLYAKAFGMTFVGLSAAANNLSDVKNAIKEAKQNPLFDRGTVVFLDEIHRFNKSQQDALLPHTENGTIILVGATTENPSFHLNNALLSRMRVLTLSPLSHEELKTLLERSEKLTGKLPLTLEGRDYLIKLSGGDGRYLLNLVENVTGTYTSYTLLTPKDLEKLLQKRACLFDRSGDGHYDLISALHKSVRGSDPDAALYWMSRMIEGGEEPLFLARRLIRMASEDIGLADPHALSHCIAAREAFQMLGSPEGELALAQAVVYLALAPKSNAVYQAFKASKKQASETGNLQPPKIIRNAPTALMKNLDYGKGYIYDHDTPEGCSGQSYFPEDLQRERYYYPVERGFEREMVKRSEYFEEIRKKNGV